MHLNGPVRHFALLLTLLLCAVSHAWAQSARWEPSGGRLPVGILNELVLIFQDCEPKANPEPPKVPGLTLVLRGTSSNTTIVNFRASSSLNYSFAVRLEKKERVQIPSFAVETDKGRVTVPAATFEAADATIGQSALSIEDVAHANFEFPGTTVWAGEVFPLTYHMEVLRRFYHQLASNPEWDPAPFVMEEWAKPELTEGNNRNEPIVNIHYRSRAFAKEPGTVTFNGAQQLLNIRTGVTMGFFNQPEIQQLSIASDQPRLTVKPLPSPAPASFSGAVGQFKLVSRVVPRQAVAGEPVTWTLELTGTGNWPAIQSLPVRSIPRALEVVQPRAKRTLAEGKLFEGTLSEDVVMIPRQAGRYSIPPLNFSYFDPRTGDYRTLSTEAVSLTITDPASPAASGTISTSPGTKTPGRQLPGSPSLPPPPGVPAPIPSDPLGTDDSASAPLEADRVYLLCLGLLLCVPLAWLALALRHALHSDPARPRRAALRRLRLLLSDTDAPVGRLLLHWQRDTRQVLGIDAAAPSSAAVGSSTERETPGLGETMSTLWSEADRVLYDEAFRLPADWRTRAVQACSQLRPPAFKPLTALRLRSLFPWLACLLLALQLTAPGTLSAASLSQAAAADPLARYAAGDFAGAREAWQKAASKDPLNLGLALLQLDQNGAAAAHLGAALALCPSDETVRHDYRVAANLAGAAPAELAFLAEDGPLPAILRLCNAAGWQQLLVLSAFLAFVALLGLLMHGYGLGFRRLKMLCWSLLVLSPLLALLSLYALNRLGPLAHKEAALVWQSSTLRSIPTEADATQKTAALPAGSLVLIDHAFLGWRHISLSSGEGGWLREGDLMALYR